MDNNVCQLCRVQTQLTKRHAERTPMGCEGTVFCILPACFHISLVSWSTLLCPRVHLTPCYSHCCCQNPTSSAFQCELKTTGSTGILRPGELSSHRPQFLRWTLPFLLGLPKLYHGSQSNKSPFNTCAFPWFCSSRELLTQEVKLNLDYPQDENRVIFYSRILGVYSTPEIQKLHQIMVVTKGGTKTRTVW